MSTIKAFELILTNSTLSDSSLLQLLDNIIIANANCTNAITYYIYTILPLNTLQQLVIEGIFDCII